MNRRRFTHAVGRRTMKRAPSTIGGAPGSLPGRVRFSATMRAAMRLDDLLGDRQAEAGVLAEGLLLVGTVGVEALEDALELIGDGCRARRRRPRSRRVLDAAGR